MKLTTVEIIKILPFEDLLKQELLDNLESYSPDTKFNIERLVWDAYDMLFQIKFNANIQLAFERAKRNAEKLDETFYKRIREQTEQEMQEQNVAEVEEEDLSSAREAMQKIIAEMKASGIKLPN